MCLSGLGWGWRWPRSCGVGNPPGLELSGPDYWQRAPGLRLEDAASEVDEIKCVRTFPGFTKPGRHHSHLELRKGSEVTLGDYWGGGGGGGGKRAFRG